MDGVKMEQRRKAFVLFVEEIEKFVYEIDNDLVLVLHFLHHTKHREKKTEFHRVQNYDFIIFIYLHQLKNYFQHLRCDSKRNINVNKQESGALTSCLLHNDLTTSAKFLNEY